MSAPPVSLLQERIATEWVALLAEEGDLGVPREAFVEAVTRTVLSRNTDGESALVALDRLVLPDLYLAMGCLAGNDRAVRRFLHRFQSFLERLSRQYAPSDAIAEEVSQDLLATLFIPRTPGEPESARLSSYRGLGTLQGWLRITARRMVIDALRSASGQPLPGTEPETLAAVPDPTPPADGDLADRQAADRLLPVLRAAISALDFDERRLILLYHRDGFVLREIAADLGIDLSSVHRRLNAVRTKVWGETRRRARQELGLEENDLRALVGTLGQGLRFEDMFVAVALALLPTALDAARAGL